MKGNSINQRVNGNGLFFTIAMLLFMVMNLTVSFMFEKRYENFVSEIESIIALKQVVYDEIPQEVQEMILGRKELSDSRNGELIESVRDTLNTSHLKYEEAERRAVLTVLGNIEQYVGQIEANIMDHTSIEECRVLLTALRSEGEACRNSLEELISSRISGEARSNHLARMTFLICFVTEIVLWFFVIVISGIMNRNLSRFLKNQIRQLEQFAGEIAEEGLDTKAPDMQTRELMPLTQSLNTMAERLKGLIAQNKEEQENLKRAEMRILQAQINPHFLYNTLDAIMWQAEANRCDEVIHITRALSDFFRISLNSGEEWITVAQEKQHLEGYLSIQKVRYRDILSYDIDISPDIENEVVLKLLLQPLAENAIYHGIKLRRGGGKITVTGKREGQYLYFCVEDTGSGMSQEKIQEITSTLGQEGTVDENGKNSGFGLRNLDLRIRLYYAQKESLHIDSNPEGTRVCFRVPAGMKGKNHV